MKNKKTKVKTAMNNIKQHLTELIDDSSTPKNVKIKSEEVICILESEGDTSINVSKALNILEELSDENNIESYIRTQIWHIVSMLESVG